MTGKVTPPGTMHRAPTSDADAEKIVDLAPWGWGVYEIDCVNCHKKYVLVQPMGCPLICDYCGNHPDIIVFPTPSPSSSNGEGNKSG